MEADKAYKDKYRDAIVINALMPTSVGIIGNTVESFSNGVGRNRRVYTGAGSQRRLCAGWNGRC